MQRTGLNRHRRGYATKEASSAVHFPASGPIGLARSQFLISISHHHYYCNSTRGSIIFKGSRVSKVLDFYRVYCTKQNLRSYHTSCQGNIKEWKYQAYHMHLGIKELQIT